MTANHDYNTPAEGTVDWHIPLNDNFQQLETDVEIRDSDANRGNYDPQNNAKFLATDTGDVYLGDGSSWNRIGSLRGGTSSGGGGMASALSSGLIVPVADGLAGTTVDPSSSSSPVQDALDMVAAKGGGTVYLPPDTVNEQGPVVMHSSCGLKGTFGESAINIDNQNTHGLLFDPDASDYTNARFIKETVVDGVTIRGPGMNNDTGIAVYDRGGMWRCHFGDIFVTGWHNAAWREEDGTNSFEVTVDYLRIKNVDAGDTEALIEWVGGGAPSQFHYIAPYPEKDASGKPSDIIKMYGGSLQVGTLNIGGIPGKVLKGIPKGFSAAYVNWEPSAKRYDEPAPSHLIECTGNRAVTIDQLHYWKPVDYVYKLYKAGSCDLARPVPRGYDSAINRNIINNAKDTGNGVVFHGKSSEVDGGTSNVTCLCDY